MDAVDHKIPVFVQKMVVVVVVVHVTGVKGAIQSIMSAIQMDINTAPTHMI